MKIADMIESLLDLQFELKIYSQTGNKEMLNSAIIRVNSLIETADYSTYLNTIKRFVYKHMMKFKEEGNESEYKRIYEVYQKLKTVKSTEDIQKNTKKPVGVVPAGFFMCF